MWFDCTKTALKKLKVAYNNSLSLNYGLGGEHYYLLTCDWPHAYINYLRKCICCFPCRIFGSSLETCCNDCSFCFIVLTCFIFIYVCSIIFLYGSRA